MATQAALEKRRRELRLELSYIENQIYDLEGSYLEETREFGNIFSGWNTYLSDKHVKVKKSVHNDERLFSMSSVTSPASKKEEKKKLPKDEQHAKKKQKKKQDTVEDANDNNDG